jgi:hypothetical protein
MRSASLAALRACAALLLLRGACAAVVRHDNSPVCVSSLPLCDSKCRGQDYFFICSAGSGPDGGPYMVCRCAAPAPPLGPQQQGEQGARASATWGARPRAGRAGSAAASCSRSGAPRCASAARSPHRPPSTPHPPCPHSPPPVHHPKAARLVLDPEIGWPGANACNQKTWANDCTSQMTAYINGTTVSLVPAVKSAFNEECAPAPGLVIGPKGTQAAVVFPQYPIGLTATGPDGTLTIDFSATAADDPNQMDWSKCILTYRIVQGSFLDPRVAQAAALQQQQALIAQQQAALAAAAPAAAAGGAGGARAGGALAAAAAGVAAAALALI